ncbi:unannotated protein [freshwater metagenome]|uniref:Unannotated protein n=1 Tax=freshwater metagenome TaxID=449393 RepID=A0A6J7USR6_9ZZZZ
MRSRWIIQAAEVSVRINQGDIATEILAHFGEGIVDRAIAVRVILAHRVADNTGTFSVWAVWAKAVVCH